MAMKPASLAQSFSVNDSAVTSDAEFLMDLWKGLYDRSPEGAEINAYLAALRNGSMTRPQVIASLQGRTEFINARNVLIANKTVNGTWDDLTGALGQTDQPGYGTNNNSGEDQAKAAMGMPYQIPD